MDKKEMKQRAMEKYFNVAGPCNSHEHYMLPALERCRGVLKLIEQKQYFVIHAARQTGKTTLLLDLSDTLNNRGDYYALYCSLETVQGIDEVEKGIPAVVRTLYRNIKRNPLLKQFKFQPDLNYDDFNNCLLEMLCDLCELLDKPLVLLFDEVDCLADSTLIGFLRQLREGFINRTMIGFVHSLALVGMRDIRDYKANIRDDRDTMGSTSPFNIVTESLTLQSFSREEVIKIYAQYKEQTGQTFPHDVIEKIIHYTQGQPWLVNAVAREVVVKILQSDFSRKIRTDHVDRAVQNIILRRDTHIDSLLERLKEKRVQRVIEPVLLGKEEGFSRNSDDYAYVRDLGLIRDDRDCVEPANPIYGEVMVRWLNIDAQETLKSENYPYALPKYLDKAGGIDMKALLTDFQQFWRENSEIWIERFEYKEAAPHLILQAFLQRVLNRGGNISREPATGRRRLDLCVHYEGRKYPVELKLRYGDRTYKEGKKQLAGYMETLNCAEGWLIVFDRRKTLSWDEKIFWETETVDGKIIHVVGG